MAKEQIQQSIVQSLSGILEKDSGVSVSQAQIEAFDKTIDALPEGKLKDFARSLKGVQKVTSKINQVYIGIQDAGWKVIKPIVVLEVPLVAGIPDKPFSKISVQAAKVGGTIGEKVVKTTVKQTENIKLKIKDLRKKKD